jgi:protoporphyrinogen oxidase
MLDEKEKSRYYRGWSGGLTAAYELYQARVKSVVLEKDKVVGGISRP